jgi:hypothetical protein
MNFHPLSSNGSATSVETYGQHQQLHAAPELGVTGMIDDWLMGISSVSDDCGEHKVLNWPNGNILL